MSGILNTAHSAKSDYTRRIKKQWFKTHLYNILIMSVFFRALLIPYSKQCWPIIPQEHSAVMGTRRYPLTAKEKLVRVIRG